MHIVLTLFVPLGIAFMMLCVGMTTSVSDFKSIQQKPKAFLIGVLLQSVSLPLIALLIAYLLLRFNYATPNIILGILILAACPGGVTSNVFTLISKGNVALSISLTSLLSLLGLITIPIVFALSSYLIFGDVKLLENSYYKISLGVFLFTTLPLLIGLLFRHLKPKLALKIEHKTRSLVIFIFILITLAAFIENKEIVKLHFATLIPIALLFNLVISLLAFISAKKLKLNPKEVITITYECGFQNNGLAILIALNVLELEQAAIFAGAYSPVMYLTGSAFHFLTKKEALKRASI